MGLLYIHGHGHDHNAMSNFTFKAENALVYFLPWQKQKTNKKTCHFQGHSLSEIFKMLHGKLITSAKLYAFIPVLVLLSGLQGNQSLKR